MEWNSERRHTKQDRVSIYPVLFLSLPFLHKFCYTVIWVIKIIELHVMKNDGKPDRISLACHRLALTDYRKIPFAKYFFCIVIGIG